MKIKTKISIFRSLNSLAIKYKFFVEESLVKIKQNKMRVTCRRFALKNGYEIESGILNEFLKKVVMFPQKISHQVVMQTLQ